MSHILSIGAIFKNEAPYLKEWLDHYINRGVDHFYLINDNSNDNYLEVLSKYENKITLFNTNNEKVKDNPQDYFYNKYIFPLISETEWILVCDIDEYIWSPIYLDLKIAIKQCEDSKIFYYKIPEVIFGNNEHLEQPKQIVNSFTKRLAVDLRYFEYVDYRYKYKTIAKSSVLKDLSVHCPWSEEIQYIQNSTNLNLNLFRMNHYRFQSIEKWNNRLSLSDSNNYTPRSKTAFCYGLNGEVNNNNNNNNNNYRNIELYKEANKLCNQVEDFDLINQNKRFSLS